MAMMPAHSWLAGQAGRLGRSSVHALVYDSGGEGNDTILYRSLRYHNVSFRVGSLASRQGKPYRGYQDRMPWLQQELSDIDTSGPVVMHVDARDTLCLCTSGELLSKHAALAQGRNAVIVAAEPFLWPDEGSSHAAYRGKSLESAYGATSNASNASFTPMTYINTGLLAAEPRALMQFFECIRRLFPQFPDACPREIAPRTGAIVTSYSEHTRYNFTKNWWHGPFACR